MDKDKNSILDKDRYIQENKCEEIKDISTYINKINKFIEIHKKEDLIYLYRGECQIYETSCRSNIFRKGVLESNKFFEKSLFDAMRQNFLSNDVRYLDNAIDAQHGEFPSRLLDVSYNCLLALYFAVTPYYHNDPDSLDHEDGMVFIFYIDEIFSPSAKNTNDNYDSIINKDKKWFIDNVIFEKNHKFIDHTKLNNRIIAQQGAFILFQGNDASDLPAYMTHGIKIPKNAKKKIREELNILFGIHTGSVYPEIMNLVDEISKKSKKLNTKEFNCYNELEYVINNLLKELNYYFEYLIYHQEKETEEVEKRILYVENVINSYRIGLLKFISFETNSDQDLSDISKDNLKKIINDYNYAVYSFITSLKDFGLNYFSERNLKITYGEE